jgi:transcriptional regulator of acetoin/glycerol metabolism
LLVVRVRQERWTVTAAARAAGISRVTAHKWLARANAEVGLQDRSSRPRRTPGRTPRMWEDMIVLLRRTRMTGPKIARELKLPAATVARVLRRHGLARLRDLEP